MTFVAQRVAFDRHRTLVARVGGRVGLFDSRVALLAIGSHGVFYEARVDE